MVGLPDEALPEMMAQAFAGNAAKLTGSHLGNNREYMSMTKSCGEKILTQSCRGDECVVEACR